MDAANTVIVLTGGAPERALPNPLPDADYIIAADSGLDLAGDLGLEVDLVIGDMDSVDPGSLEAAVARGASVERHPADKDATDLELALTAATDQGANRIILVGGAGGRLDHMLANALALAAVEGDAAVEWWTGRYRSVIVRTTAELVGSAGDTVSLLPIGGPATGVQTTGLRWPLSGETLRHGSTRGISNEMTAAVATIVVGSGALLALHEWGSR